MNQSQLIRDVLERNGMSDAKAVKTPLAAGYKFLKADDDSEIVNLKAYQSLVGSLMYIMTSTRPDIAYAVSCLSRHLMAPTAEHWIAAKRILRYLRGTINMALVLGGFECKLQGLSDADWAGDVNDRKSTTGFVFTLGAGAISWKSRKQTTVALSTTEAEYMACADAAKEGLYLIELLSLYGNQK